MVAANPVCGATDHLASAPTLAVEPEGLGRVEAARFLGMGASTFDRLVAAGKVPEPVRLTRRPLWPRSERADWMRAGCPSAAEWKRTKSRAGRSAVDR